MFVKRFWLNFGYFIFVICYFFDVSVNILSFIFGLFIVFVFFVLFVIFLIIIFFLF